VGHAVEGQQVMLAQAGDADVAHQHKLVVVGFERRREHLPRVDPKPGEQLGVRPGDPRRRLAQAVAVGILTHGEQDLPHRLLDPGQVDVALHRAAGVAPVDDAGGEVVEFLRKVVGVGLGGAAPPRGARLAAVFPPGERFRGAVGDGRRGNGAGRLVRAPRGQVQWSPSPDDVPPNAFPTGTEPGCSP
jgi:hypothetical protein